MKPIFSLILILATVGCSLLPLATTEPSSTQALLQPTAEQSLSSTSQAEMETPLTTEMTTSEATPHAESGAVLFFTIGMHIEPLGETAQGYGSGKGDYHQTQLFQRHVQDILTVTGIVEAHGGRMTIQAQSPFTQVAIASGNTILADLAARGHEIALHFHEDAHLGKNSGSLSVQQWCEVMKQEIELIKQASGVSEVRYWSGGNLYPHVYEAAECAGLDVNSDWKNPRTQSADPSLLGVNPWRPAGGTDGTDFTLFTQHDPFGAVVFLPEGQYDKSNFASMRRSQEAGGDEAYFEYLKQSLYASLAAAQPDKVNVFHFTVHPGEFRGDAANPFAVIEKFLTEVVDPLVASGQVQWVTFSEMADAYIAWEAAHPGVNPRAEQVSAFIQPLATLTAESPVLSSTTFEGRGASYTVTNPTSGATLYMAVFYPDDWDGRAKLPTLVLVPGGNGDSSSFIRKPPKAPTTVEVINQAGYAAVVFDPDGRGRSGGTENYNGFIHQDGLSEVIHFAATLPGIDSAKIGLVTYSYGITMGAGALARHPNLPVKFLIDWEGPANRDDTGGCDGAARGHLQKVASCTDEAFWAEREASTFIGQIRVPYQRVQSQTDHVQPDNAHAILMINNALSGGVPWVRLNNEAPNQTYDPANPPAMLPDAVLDLQRDHIIVEYAQELFAL